VKQGSKTNILCLDGGGAKGIYTLGVLSELEKAVNKPLAEFFQLIYGTSTGSIIAAMVALGLSVDEIKSTYLELVPTIMSKRTKEAKSKALRELGQEIFGERKFEDFKTGIGVVAMNYETQKPLIFKNEINRAYGTKSSFVPGFGVTILDAIEASCAACPIFNKKILETVNKEQIIAIDGGFIANNPTLFAIIDAKKALKLQDEDIKLLSIGVGNYIEKPIRMQKFFSRFEMAQIASRVLVASSNTTEVITNLLFPELDIVRVNESFNQPENGTNMLEKDLNKLRKMFKLGIGSYASHEKSIISLFEIN
jgi:patatin-like phospholipase/acyl hydrolase